MASRGLRFGYTVRRGGEILAAGATDHVWVDAGRRRPCRIPAVLEPAFRRLAGAGD